MTPSQLKIWNALKEKRFTGTARVLGGTLGEQAQVIVVSDVNQPPAWCDSTGRIVINDAVPRQRNEVLSLVWERGKLYHEILHLLFTTDDKMRADLASKSSDPSKYLWVSNALEDGRIEYHGEKMYAGITYYIRTVLQDLLKDNSAASGLLIYVRTKLWRNAKEHAFWMKYEAQINEAITAPESKTVWQITRDIVEDMEANKPPPPPPVPQHIKEAIQDLVEEQGESSEDDRGSVGEQSEDQESGESEESDSGDSGDSEEDENSEDSEGQDEDSGDESGDEGDFDDNIGDHRPPPPDNAGKDSGDNDTDVDDVPRIIDEDVKNKIKEIVDEAIRHIDAEVRDELVQLKDEFANYDAPQEYATNDEETQAHELGELFSTLQVESQRQRYRPCKYGGTLDPDRLIETRTDGMFMHESVEKPSQPHIVLLIDESCSMEGSRNEVSEAARILNGAIKASGAKSIAVSFGRNVSGNQCQVYPIVPVEGFRCDGYSTPTHLGLQAAKDWLDRESARRGMVIVITDGCPDNAFTAGTVFEELKDNGYYVLNVILGCYADQTPDESLRLMCHQWIKVDKVSDLMRDLEAPLSDFMAGAF